MIFKFSYCLFIYLLLVKYSGAQNDAPEYKVVQHYEQFNEQPEVRIPENWYRINKTSECKNWFESVMDFFFGDADESRGHPGGVFTRMITWVRRGLCRMNGNCPEEQPYPTPDFPSPQLPSIPEYVPPTEPDAEIIPDEANDVQ